MKINILLPKAEKVGMSRVFDLAERYGGDFQLLKNLWYASSPSERHAPLACKIKQLEEPMTTLSIERKKIISETPWGELRNKAKLTPEMLAEVERLAGKRSLSRANRELLDFLSYAHHDRRAFPFVEYYKYANTAEKFDKSVASGSFKGWTKKGVRMARELCVRGGY